MKIKEKIKKSDPTHSIVEGGKKTIYKGSEYDCISYMERVSLDYKQRLKIIALPVIEPDNIPSQPEDAAIISTPSPVVEESEKTEEEIIDEEKSLSDGEQSQLNNIVSLYGSMSSDELFEVAKTAIKVLAERKYKTATKFFKLI